MSLINDALKRAKQAQQTENQPPSPEGPFTVSSSPPTLKLLPTEEPSQVSRRLMLFIPAAFLLAAGTWYLWQGWRSGPPPEANVGLPTPVAARAPASSTASGPARHLNVASATLKKWATRQDDPAASPGPTAPSVPSGHTVRSSPTGASATPPVERPAAPPAAAATPQTAAPSASSGLAPAASVPSPAVASAPESSPAAPAPPPPRSLLSPAGLIAAINPARRAPVTATDSSSQLPAIRAADLKLQGIFYRLKNPTALIAGRVLSIGDEVEGYRVSGIERHAVRLTAADQTFTLTLR